MIMNLILFIKDCSTFIERFVGITYIIDIKINYPSFVDTKIFTLNKTTKVIKTTILYT